MQERRKILYVITKGNMGGAQRYVLNLSTHLPKEEFEAVVACGVKEGAALQEKLSEKNIRTIDLENSEREINLKNDFKTVKDLVKIIKEEKPNIVHFNSSKIGFLGILAIIYFKFSAPNLKLKTLFTSHGWAFNEKHRYLISRLMYYVAHYLTVLICDKTIAVSYKTREDIIGLPFIKEKISVIPNGIAPFTRISRHAALEILKKEEGQINIFSLSELHPNKGLDVALRGLSLLPKEYKKQIQYYVAGPGEEKESLQKLAQELNISERVHFLGFSPDAKRLLSGADIFLFPSRTENLPFAILEAGISGLPIIATSVGGVPEIIKDMQNGILVHKNNPKETAEAIIYLLEHKKERREFGAAIEQTITHFFSLDQMLSKTTSLYSKLLDPLPVR